jgi:hypothetical protein
MAQRYHKSPQIFCLKSEKSTKIWAFWGKSTVEKRLFFLKKQPRKDLIRIANLLVKKASVSHWCINVPIPT